MLKFCPNYFFIFTVKSVILYPVLLTYFMFYISSNVFNTLCKSIFSSILFLSLFSPISYFHRKKNSFYTHKYLFQIVPLKLSSRRRRRNRRKYILCGAHRGGGGRDCTRFMVVAQTHVRPSCSLPLGAII